MARLRRAVTDPPTFSGLTVSDAYQLLSPITGAKAAALFFGIALLASRSSSPKITSYG
jgi:Mn2+/Fe2+ NRAMP family transporter